MTKITVTNEKPGLPSTSAPADKLFVDIPIDGKVSDVDTLDIIKRSDYRRYRQIFLIAMVTQLVVMIAVVNLVFVYADLLSLTQYGWISLVFFGKSTQ